MPDLLDVCLAVVSMAAQDEVEVYAEEGRRTEVHARAGEVERLTVAESRGIGIRVVAEERLGHAWAADPTMDMVAGLLDRARDGARLAEPDDANVLPPLRPVQPLGGLYRPSQAQLGVGGKLRLAVDLERVAVSSHAEVRQVETATYGDSTSRVAISSTRGGPIEYLRTNCWAYVNCLAERSGERQTGSAYELARDAGELDWERAARVAAERAARVLGGAKPPTRECPVVLDPVATAAFLSVLGGALSAELAQKGRSLLSDMMGARIGSPAVTMIDDGRLELGPAARPFDDEGVASRRTVLAERGVLRSFMHTTATAARQGTSSTANAGRRSYRATPRVAWSNLFMEPGGSSQEELIRQAGHGVYVQEVTGLHSGASPTTGAFSVGAVGLEIVNGALAGPVREITIASTLLDVLGRTVAVGSDARFFPFGGGAVGAPSILVGEMSVAGR
jgi:PmbA protein